MNIADKVRDSDLSGTFVKHQLYETQLKYNGFHMLHNHNVSTFKAENNHMEEEFYLNVFIFSL